MWCLWRVSTTKQFLELYLTNLAALKAELNSLSTEGDHEYVYSDGYYATLTWLLHHWLHLANGSVTWSGGTILDTNMLPKPFNALHCVIHRPQNRKGSTLTKHYEMNGHSRSPSSSQRILLIKQSSTRSCLCFNFPRCLMMLTCQWWCAGPRRGVFDKLERTRSRWSRDNWNRPDLNSQPVSHRGAGTGPGDIITCESMRVLSRGREWRWCRSLWPPLWGPPGATPDCFRIILKYLKTGPPRRNCLFFFTGRIKIQEIMKTNERLIAEI